MAAVNASGLTKRYHDVRALESVDLAVQEGEVRGLLGPNGAGKTTLLRILLGLVAADAGTIELLGRRLEPTDPAPIDGVAGFVEEPTFYPYLSGRANLEILAELDRPGARERIDEALERAGIGARAGDRVGGYSSGMRQRLGLAAALLPSPRLLLLDEPTNGLDPEGAGEIAGVLRGLAREGVAVLLSSHLIGELESLCDSFSVLGAGRLLWAGSATELRAQAHGSSYRLRTSDNRRAGRLAAGRPGLLVEQSSEEGLVLSATQAALDDFVLALAAAGVAVRHLALATNALESAFFALTGSDGTGGQPDR